MHARLLPPLVLALGAPAAAQTVIFPVGGSLDASSPEVEAHDDVQPGSVHVMGSRVTRPIPGEMLEPGGGWPLYSGFGLGLGWLPGGGKLDVDALTNARDTFDAADVRSSGDRVIDVEYTLGRTGGGAPGTDPLVLAQYASGSGNGAASDTFLARFADGARLSFEHATDALGLTPRLGGNPWSESNLDALVHGTTPAYPVYFSLSGETAWMAGVSPADILRVDAPGAVPSVYLRAKTLGLEAGDDINALVMREDGGGALVEVIFSLSKHSPSVGGSAPFFVAASAAIPVHPQPPPIAAALMASALQPVGSAGLVYVRYAPPGPADPAGPPSGWTANPWATPEDLGLGWAGGVLDPDDVTGARVHDPLFLEHAPPLSGNPPAPKGGKGLPKMKDLLQLALGEALPFGDGPFAPKSAVLAVDVHELTVNESVGGRDRRLALDPWSEVDVRLRSTTGANGPFTLYMTPGTLFDTPATLDGDGRAVYVDPDTSEVLASGSKLPFHLPLDGPGVFTEPHILQALISVPGIGETVTVVTNAIEVQVRPWF